MRSDDSNGVWEVEVGRDWLVPAAPGRMRRIEPTKPQEMGDLLEGVGSGELGVEDTSVANPIGGQRRHACFDEHVERGAAAALSRATSSCQGLDGATVEQPGSARAGMAFENSSTDVGIDRLDLHAHAVGGFWSREKLSHEWIIINVDFSMGDSQA